MDFSLLSFPEFDFFISAVEIHVLVVDSTGSQFILPLHVLQLPERRL